MITRAHTDSSPVFSHIGASMKGLSCVRAFANQEVFIREFDQHLVIIITLFVLTLLTYSGVYSTTIAGFNNC